MRNLRTAPGKSSVELCGASSAPMSFSILENLKPSCRSASESSWKITTSTRSRCGMMRSEEHTSELHSRFDLVCRLLLEKKKKKKKKNLIIKIKKKMSKMKKKIYIINNVKCFFKYIVIE